MSKQNGFISITLLLVCLLMASGAHLLYRYVAHEQQRVAESIFGEQARLLNTSLFHAEKVRSLPNGSHLLYENFLEPGHEKIVATCEKAQSENGLFGYFAVKTVGANHVGAVQLLQELTMTIPETQQAWAQQYVLVTPELVGEEYLSQDVYIQASKEEVTPPAMDFLSGKANTELEMDDLKKYGFSKTFYYMNGNNATTFQKGLTFYGDAVIFSHRGITIGDNCAFKGRMIIISDAGNITLGKNVRFDKCLLMTTKRVSIAANCQFTGLICANKISLTGSSTFTPAPDVVAPFVSRAYLK